MRAAEQEDSGDITLIDDRGALRQFSYRALLGRACRVLGGLRRTVHPATGMLVRRGDVVILQIDDIEVLLAAFWACQLGGYLPLPMRPGRTPEERATGRAALQAMRVVVGAPLVFDGLEPIEAECDLDWYEPVPDDPAVLLLTSGSTGRPKAVTLTHANILARSAATIAARRLTVRQRSFNWLPLDHVGGLVMFHIRDVLLGCTQVHADMSWVLADPTRWLEAMSQHRSSSTWAPNFAFSLIVDRADELAGRNWNLKELGYIMNGGEPVNPRTARRFLSLLAPYGLPGNALHPGWGMSETSSGVVDCVFDSAAERDERFVSLGQPHPGVRLRVVDEDGNVVPAGVVGRLLAAGPPITAGYFRDPEQNRRSFTNDGWFKTGDLAVIRDGRLIVTGRVDDTIHVGGATYYGHELEAAVEELAGIEPSFTVACSLPGETSDQLAVFVSLREGVDQAEAVSAIDLLLRTEFGAADALIFPVPKADIPKTNIGKLRRALMRDWVRAKSTAPQSSMPKGSSVDS